MSYMNMIVQGLYIWKAPHPLASQLSIVLCGVWEQPQAYSNSHIPQSKIQAPTCWCVGASIKRGEIKMNSTMRPSIGQVSLVEYFFLGRVLQESISPSFISLVYRVLPLWLVHCLATKVWGIRNLKWFMSGTVVPEILPVWLWVWGWGCWGGGYLGIQDEIRHERIHESWLRWITIY